MTPPSSMNNNAMPNISIKGESISKDADYPKSTQSYNILMALIYSH